MKFLFSTGAALFLAIDEFSHVEVAEDIITFTTPAGETRTIKVNKPLISKTNPLEKPKEATLVEKTSDPNPHKSPASEINPPDRFKEAFVIGKSDKSESQVLDSKTDTLRISSDSVSVTLERKQGIYEELKNLEDEILNLKERFISDAGKHHCIKDPDIFAKELKQIREKCDSNPEIVEKMREKTCSELKWMEGLTRDFEKYMAEDSCRSEPTKRGGYKRRRGKYW